MPKKVPTMAKMATQVSNLVHVPKHIVSLSGILGPAAVVLDSPSTMHCQGGICTVIGRGVSSPTKLFRRLDSEHPLDRLQGRIVHRIELPALVQRNELIRPVLWLADWQLACTELNHAGLQTALGRHSCPGPGVSQDSPCTRTHTNH